MVIRAEDLCAIIVAFVLVIISLKKYYKPFFSALRHYADFKGESTLKDFTGFFIPHFLIAVWISTLHSAFYYHSHLDEISQFSMVVLVAYLALTVVPLLAVEMRCYRAQGKKKGYLALFAVADALLIAAVLLVTSIQGFANDSAYNKEDDYYSSLGSSSYYADDEKEDSKYSDNEKEEEKTTEFVAKGPTLPDFQAFSGDCCREGIPAIEENYTSVYCAFNRNAKLVNEYLDLIEEYGFVLRDTYENELTAGSINHYTYDYVGKGNVEKFEYWFSYVDGDNISLAIKVFTNDSITIEYGDGIDYVDTGDRTTQTLTPHEESPAAGGSSGSSGSSGSASGSAYNSSFDYGNDDDDKIEIDCFSCLDGTERCSACNGKGGKYNVGFKPNYAGKTDYDRTYKTWEDCYKCNGSGKQDCSYCDGKEVVYR